MYGMIDFVIPELCCLILESKSLQWILTMAFIIIIVIQAFQNICIKHNTCIFCSPEGIRTPIIRTGI